MTQNKTFLQNLNWERDQGIQLAMINGNRPQGRNQFYDKILQENVSKQRCIDIGFGTGLLSMLAIKHGATHVEAWEENEDRYALGRYIIKKLNLQNKICLFHGSYNHHENNADNKIVFHEIIGANIWNESLRNSLPLNAKLVLPGIMHVDLDIVGLEKSTYQMAFMTKRIFDPGVELVTGFTDLVQSLIDQTPQKNHFRESLFDNSIANTLIKSLPYYTIDFNKLLINNKKFDCIPNRFSKSFEFTVDDDQVWLLYPRIHIEHDNHKLHWGWYRPIVVDQSGNYNIEQSFAHGNFTVYKVD